ncbi:MAG: uroporphyrinogen-III synthase [Bacteroidota bacterium]
MYSTIFISKNSDELSLLPSFFAANNSSLSAFSLIDFQAIPFEIKAPYDVLFFGSIRSFNFFTQLQNIPTHVQLACIGEGTANRIKERGYQLDFIGEFAGEPDKVAATFKAWLDTKRVLIPVSSQSNRSIARALPTSQFEEVIVYSTVHKEIHIPPHDLYIFTSPSNVDSFLAVQEIPAKATVIAWGTTTEKRLVEHGAEVMHSLRTSTEKELINFLSKEL